MEVLKKKKKRIYKILFVLSIIFLWSSVSYSKTLVVDNNPGFFGLISCENTLFPYRTIGQALANAKSGDTIKICAGSYNESDVITVNNLTITAGANVSKPSDVDWHYKGVVLKIGNYNKGVRGFKIENISIRSTSSSKNAIDVVKAEGKIIFDNISIKVRNGDAINVGWGVNVDNLTFKDINIQTNGGDGLLIRSGKDVYIDNVTIAGSAGDKYGIFMDWGVDGDYQLKNVNMEVSSRAIYIAKGNDVTLSNVKINNSSDNSNYYGIKFDWGNFQNIDLSNCEVNVPGDGIDVSGSSNLIIDSSNIKSRGKNAIWIGTNVEKMDLKNSCIYNDSNDTDSYGINVDDWNSDININNNCIYAPNGGNYAKDVKDGHNWDDNYWDGVVDVNGDGKISSADSNKIGPHVVDNSPLDSCPNNCNISNVPKPVLDYRMDECSWDNNPSTYEITDQENHDNATAENGADTIPKGVLCRAGNFYGKYMKLEHAFRLKRKWSMSFWLKFPLKPSSNQFSIGRYYYFIIASVRGTGDLGYFKKYKNSNNYWFGVYDNRGNFNGDEYIGSISDGWHFFVLVNNGRNTKLYIDGSSIFYKCNLHTTGRLTLIGTSTDSSSDETIGSYMDEVKFWNNRTLTKTQIQAIYNNELNGKNYNGTIRICLICAKLNHYEIWHYPSNLTCQPAPVEIRACADDNCSTLYTDNVTLTLDYDGKSKQVSFSGGEDNTTINYTQAGTITLSTSGESPTPFNNTTCHIFNSSSTSCSIEFKDTGFVFKTPTNSNYNVNNGISCTSYPIEIDAVEKDNTTNRCTNISAFNGEVSVNLYGRYITSSSNPYHTKVIVDNTTTIETVNNGSNATGTPVTLNFNSGSAKFYVTYPDAGSISIGAIYDNSSSGLHVDGESNPFVIKPAKFILDNLSNPADNSTCASDKCWSDIGVFKKAGEVFNFTVEAVCDNGTITPNYYPINQNGDNSTVNISATMIAPDNGTSASSKLGKTAIEASEFSGGKATVDEYFNDVGVIRLTVKQSNYLGAGEIEGDRNIGRFTPDHFKITSKTDGILDERCATFNYTGQATTYSTRPSFVITAQNRDNGTTKNYKDDFFKLSASDISITKPTTDDNKTGAQGIKVAIDIIKAASTLEDNKNGTGTYTFGYDNVTYVKDNNSKIEPFSPEFTFKIDNITDSDGVSAIELPDNLTVSGLSMKYGRLKIFDNYGPETENLKINLKTQFWNGTYWKLNSDDNCESLTKSDFKLDNFTGHLSAGEAYIIDDSVEGISTGLGDFILKAPGENNYGTVNICLSDNASFYDYLNDEETCGVATFGIYRGRDRIIEWKEIPAQ